MKVCIDPGHGGKDKGGGSNKYFLEKDEMLSLSLLLGEALLRNNIDVYFTRTDDEYLTVPVRIDRVNEGKADLCISNHFNSVAPGLFAEGIEVIHSIHTDGKLANMVKDELVNIGLKFRRVFCKEHPRLKGKDYYYMNRRTNCETIIIEYGFDCSEGDIVRYLENKEKIVEVVARAICNYLGVPYTAKESEIDWRLQGEKWLHDMGLTAQRHDPEESVDFGELGTILKRFYDKVGGCKCK